MTIVGVFEKSELAAEAVIVFGGLPVLFDGWIRRGRRGWLFPGLWLLGAIALSVLLADPSFPRERLVLLPHDGRWWVWLVVRTVALVGLLAFVAWRASPDAFLELPRRRPALFALIAFFYPVLSVLPQGLVWRVFFLHRYEPLFGDGPVAWVAAAAAFAWAHVIFRNPMAIALTAIGGALFVHTYVVTGSMILADVEHAIYGLSVFAFGFGRFLYLGAARAAPARASA
jgi:hypothetical protein